MFTSDVDIWADHIPPFMTHYSNSIESLLFLLIFFLSLISEPNTHPSHIHSSCLMYNTRIFISPNCCKMFYISIQHILLAFRLHLFIYFATSDADMNIFILILCSGCGYSFSDKCTQEWGFWVIWCTHFPF